MLDNENRAFYRVAEGGSFTVAAEKLATSKARVSQQVSALEKRLGVTLFHRSTRHVRLTPAGQAYFSEIQRAWRIMVQAEQQLREQQGSIAGRISINSVGGLFAEGCLAPAISSFLRAYPEVDIQLDFTSARVDLLTDAYDLVVRMGALEDSSLIARQLMMLGAGVVASPNYLRSYNLQSPADLSQLNCLCGSIKKWRFVHRSTGEVDEVTVSGPLVSANGHILRQAALEGLGAVRLHDLYIQDDIASGNLIHVVDEWEVAPQPVSLVYPKARFQRRCIQVLIEFLVDWFRNLE